MSVAVHAWNGDSRGIQQLLEGGADVECTDGSGRTALMIAILNGHVPICRMLIEAQADVNAVSAEKWSPLLLAANSGRYGAAVATMLVEANANIDFRSPAPSGVECGDIERPLGETALMIACKEGHQQVAQLLVLANADVNLQDADTGETILTLSTQLQSPALTQLLIDHRAHVEAKNADGSTALQVAERDMYAAHAIPLLRAAARRLRVRRKLQARLLLVLHLMALRRRSNGRE